MVFVKNYNDGVSPSSISGLMNAWNMSNCIVCTGSMSGAVGIWKVEE
jgi:hypothetical protein